MRKTNKIIIGVVAVVLVVSAIVLAERSDLFQGSFKKISPAPRDISRSVLFWYRNIIVSAVTSPVTSPVSSVVVSNVTSCAGTSRVASVVTSPVASAVASAVALNKESAAGIDTKNLQTLTGRMLSLIARQDYNANPSKFTSKAKEDYIANPGKFALTASAKKRLIDLYKQKNPSQFIFRKL